MGLSFDRLQVLGERETVNSHDPQTMAIQDSIQEVIDDTPAASYWARA